MENNPVIDASAVTDAQEVLSSKAEVTDASQVLSSSNEESTLGDIDGGGELDSSKMFSGHFFEENGFYLGKWGSEANSQTCYILASGGYSIETDQKTKQRKLIVNPNTGFKGILNDTNGNSIIYPEFVDLAGTLYAEGSYDSSLNSTYEEYKAIYSVIRNRAIVRQNSLYIQAQKEGIFGWSEKGKIKSKNADQQKARAAYKAIIDVFLTGIDYSKGAYFWQGKDFSIKEYKDPKNPQKITGTYAYIKFYLAGFKFLSPDHDIWGLGNTQVADKPYNFLFESTGAWGKTTFMRYTEEFKEATKHPKEYH